MKKRVLKTFNYLLILILVLITAGFIYEQASRAYFDKKRPNESDFIKVDGRKIHFKKQGNGSTTIVFESGLGGDYLHWQEIQNKLSKDYTTISYDKAGILWSDPTEDVSLKRYSNDLFQLLEKTNCPKPYILVGHSFAGITLRSFIKEHPENIQGIVFVDVSHPEQLKKSSEDLKNSVTPPSRGFLRFLNETGGIRMLYTLVPFTQSVPKEHIFNQNVKNNFYKIFDGLMQEMENDEKLMEEAEKINTFGSVPLVVITAQYPQGVENIPNKELEKEYLSVHNSMQKDLLNLSVNSTQFFASKSGHYVTLQEPELLYKAIDKIADKRK
ncbi:alpha/beta fold hydrolase [Flavobacterium gelatinilyticum]|uniref:alpha/beta fold hydrolase n=1 Tax=Flavobacterium gelatinilyticum TaxID=3003260 RepID=UPI0024801ACA|nr:alpha/beta hydrolase [Flavobacterium gelatinilyticum]